MTSPMHRPNRFGFQGSTTPTQMGSPSLGKVPARFTPSPTKIDSPRIALNNNTPDNGNHITRNNSNLEINGRVSLSPFKAHNAKGAYLCLKVDYNEDLMTENELKKALQISGHNPTDDLCHKLWGNRLKMSYNDFERVLETLGPPPSEDNLIDLFRKLDPTNKGIIPKPILFEALTYFGDQMSQEKLSEILKQTYQENVGLEQQENFDYKSFCQFVKNTSQDLTAIANELANIEGQNYAVNSKTYRVRKKSASPLKTPSVWANQCSTLKGAFYFEGETLISHQYTMKIFQKGRYQISIHPTQGFNVDCQLFLFKINESSNSNKNLDSRFTLIDRTPLVIPMKKRKDDEKILQNSSAWQGILDKGTYLLVPSTTGCKLRKRTSQPPSDVELVVVNENPTNGQSKYSLSDKFRKALREIFYQVDLDSNGNLSRDEFNLFNWRTSGEEVQDDEWRVVKDNFALEDGELTLEGFLQLHQMEADDNGGDSAELWVTLNAMGFNHALIQDEIALFEVSVHSETGAEPVSLTVSGLKSGGPLLDKSTIRCIMEGAKIATVVDSGKEIVLYKEDASNLTSVVLQNKSSVTVSLSMDFTESRNVLINHPHLKFSTTLSARSTLFVAQLIPENPNAEFKPELNVSLVR